MKNQSLIFLFRAFIVFAILLINETVTAQSQYVENFSTTQYKNTQNTTAFWDVKNHDLKLPGFEFTPLGGYDTPDANTFKAVISGHLVFVANSFGGLLALDITDPGNPTFVSIYKTGDGVMDVAIDGDYAYVANRSSGLLVIDISDPENPSFVGSCNTLHQASGVAIAGDYAYVADSDSGLLVIDIHDPGNPVLAGKYKTHGTAEKVTLWGDYAFVVNASQPYAGLQIINISDPVNPFMEGSYNKSVPVAVNVAVAGNYAYMACLGSGMLVIDISDPGQPLLAASYVTSGFVRDIVTDGNYAYVADDNGGMQILDISDPTQPRSIGEYDGAPYVWGVALNGDIAVVVLQTGIQVIKICDPVTPKLAGKGLVPGNTAVRVAIAGNYAYVTGRRSGLHIFDISDPFHPLLTGSYNSSDPVGVFISGNYAFVADRDSGLLVIDISDPGKPLLIGYCNTQGQFSGVTVSGDYAYVTDVDPYSFGLHVIDISTPADPKNVAYYATPLYAWDVAVGGDYAYVAGYGLRILDISDPLHPALVGACKTPGSSEGVAVSGKYAYIADNVNSLQVIDISDPANPSISGSFDTPAVASQVTVTGNYAFVGDDESGLQVIDISEPTHPALIGSYDTPGYANGVAVAGDYAYIADYSDGLLTIEVFQRSYNLAANTGQSLPLNKIKEDICRARIKTTQTDSVHWNLSPDNGNHWEKILADNNWHAFTNKGDQLIWRSTHSYAGGGINPSCSNLEIDWLYDSAIIDSVVDVPADQGNWLRLYFSRSGLDFADETEFPVAYYYIFRRVDNTDLKNQVIKKGRIIDVHEKSITIPGTRDHAQVYSLQGRYFLISNALSEGDLPPGTWEVVGNVPAHQDDHYICLVPALSDLSSGLNYSVYCISAETTTPAVFYFSPPDSGYAIDNLVPSTPDGLQAAAQDTSIKLAWHAVADSDFRYYAIYRGTDTDFVPDNSNFLTTTTDTVYSDGQVFSGNTYYYRISAFDFAGNESDYSIATSCLFTAIGKNGFAEIPFAFSLSQNFPNPFNPATEIRYNLPRNCHVTLEIYNTRGQRIITLVNEQQTAGYKSINFDARSMSSGIYFYHLHAGKYVNTKSMLLIK